jgi:hypothetical protein
MGMRSSAHSMTTMVTRYSSSEATGMASGPAGGRGWVRALCACTPTPTATIRLHRLIWFQKRLAGRGRPATPVVRRSAGDASAIDSGAGSHPSATGPLTWRRLATNQAAASTASAALAYTNGSTRPRLAARPTARSPAASSAMQVASAEVAWS